MEINILQGSGIDTLPQFLTSLAIGLLIGLERERNPTARAGLRTFALVALFGTLSAMLAQAIASPWLLVAGLVLAGSMIITAYYRNTNAEDHDPGTTTIAALMVCYLLGVLVWYGQSRLAIMLAIATTTLLYFKPELRGMTQRMTRKDIVSILQFLVLTFIILPILPDENIGPYGAFNPYQAWMMVVLISGLSLAGYIALHWSKFGYGPELLGFLGGLVSSTATTLAYSRHARDNESMVHLSATVILISSQVVMLRLLVISLVIAPDITSKLLIPMGSGLIMGIIATLLGRKALISSTELPKPSSANPTELPAAMSFAMIYVAVLLASAWISDIAGNPGLYAVSAISGLTDVDAITLSSLRLFDLEKLAASHAVTAISIAFLTNMLLKFSLIVFVGGRKLAIHILSGFAAMCTGVGIGLLML